MAKTFFRTLAFVLLVKGLHGREIFRSIDIKNVTDIATFRPILTSERLHEVRLYDRMKCFPKILCTLTKTGAFTQLGRVSLNDLADGYLRLLTAFPGGPPSDLTKNTETFVRDSSPSLQDSRDDDGDSEHQLQTTRDDNDSKELLLSDPLLHHKEKLEMQKLMAELRAEDKAEKLRQPSSWTSSAMLIPLQIGSSLLRDIVLPYLVGDPSRRKRDFDSYFNTNNDNRNGKGIDVNQDPIVSAMKRWNKLKSPQACGKVYAQCPFEAWEVVSMIKLIKDSSAGQR